MENRSHISSGSSGLCITSILLHSTAERKREREREREGDGESERERAIEREREMENASIHFGISRDHRERKRWEERHT